MAARAGDGSWLKRERTLSRLLILGVGMDCVL